ncbi:MAG: DUF4258 domain-containing protein [Calditrichaeota bacterium]|nr:DUF4258 domain-containing protein [Calditrichota bacterium]
MNLNAIIQAIKNHNIRISDHAVEEAENDGFQFSEIFYSVLHGEIIEDYPNDKPFPSCLIFGLSRNNEPIHTVWAYNNSNHWAVLITVYRPDVQKWINWKERRKK